MEQYKQRQHADSREGEQGLKDASGNIYSARQCEAYYDAFSFSKEIFHKRGRLKIRESYIIEHINPKIAPLFTLARERD